MKGRRLYRALDGSLWWVPRPGLWQRLRARAELWGVALGLWVVVTACAPPVRPTPVPAPDPSPPGACAAAAAKLEELQCRDRALDGGLVDLWVGFQDACESSERDGLDWNAQHIACVENCDQVNDAWDGRWTCPSS